MKHDFSNQIHKVKIYESPHQVNIKVYPLKNYLELWRVASILGYSINKKKQLEEHAFVERQSRFYANIN